jgi:hypothetical protein
VKSILIDMSLSVSAHITSAALVVSWRTTTNEKNFNEKRLPKDNISNIF